MVHLGQVATMVVLLAREGAAGAQDVRARHGYSGVGGGDGGAVEGNNGGDSVVVRMKGKRPR
jgi:hypothetical protein